MAKLQEIIYLERMSDNVVIGRVYTTNEAADSGNAHMTQIMFKYNAPQNYLGKKMISATLRATIDRLDMDSTNNMATIRKPGYVYKQKNNHPYIAKEFLKNSEIGEAIYEKSKIDSDVTEMIDSSGIIGLGGFAFVGPTNGNPVIYVEDAPNLTNRPQLILTYADAPGKPVLKHPIYGTVISGLTRFTWEYNPSQITGLPQKSYNLQLSTNGIDWNTLSETTSNQYADIPASDLPGGNFYWRVQTIDTDNVPSDYSDQAYAYYGTAPAAPSIITSIFTKSKPRLAWSTSFEQYAYKVRVLLGEVAVIEAMVESSDQYYDIPVQLANNTQYTVQVAARDAQAHFSEWATDTISAVYMAPEVPTFIASKKKDSVELTITNYATNTEAIRHDIFRYENEEYVRIGSTTSSTYNDWSASAGEQRYKIAAVGEGGETMSEHLSVMFDITTAFLTAVNDPEEPFEVKYNVIDRHYMEHEVVLVEYAGRRKPVAEYGEIEQRSVNVSFASNDKLAYRRLNKIIQQKETVLFRNARIKIYGVCTNPNEQPADYSGTIYNLSFIISEIEHSEVI